MPTILKPAPKEILKQFSDILQKQHQDLFHADVRFCLMVASNDEGPAVLLHGYPCAATVKINSAADRAEGKADCTIKIDMNSWPDRKPEEQLAILDHELEHVELVRDDQGEIREDWMGRPKLRLKLHDWQLGGFHAIVDRHEQHALEAQAFISLSQSLSQKTFAWG